MPFLVLDPLAGRKDKFCSLEAYISMEMLPFKKVQCKRFWLREAPTEGRWGHFQAKRATWKKGQW